MLAVSPPRGSSGEERDGEVGELAGNFSDDTLLEDINFDDLFMGFDDGDILPDLEVDPAEFFSDGPRGGEASSGMVMAVESAVGSDGGGQENGLMEGEMKVEKDLSRREEVMSATTKEDTVAVAAEVRSPSSEADRGRKSTATATKNSQGKRKVKVGVAKGYWPQCNHG